VKTINSLPKDEFDNVSWPFKNMEIGEKVEFLGSVAFLAERALASYQSSKPSRERGLSFTKARTHRFDGDAHYYRLVVTRTDSSEAML